LEEKEKRENLVEARQAMRKAVEEIEEIQELLWKAEFTFQGDELYHQHAGAVGEISRILECLKERLEFWLDEV